MKHGENGFSYYLAATGRLVYFLGIAWKLQRRSSFRIEGGRRRKKRKKREGKMMWLAASEKTGERGDAQTTSRKGRRRG